MPVNALGGGRAEKERSIGEEYRTIFKGYHWNPIYRWWQSLLKHHRLSFL